MRRNGTVRRVHALVVIPGPLRPRMVQEERAHVFRDTSVYVRSCAAVETPLGRTGRRAGPGRFVPPTHRLVRHLHNHQLRFFLQN